MFCSDTFFSGGLYDEMWTDEGLGGQSGSQALPLIVISWAWSAVLRLLEHSYVINSGGGRQGGLVFMDKIVSDKTLTFSKALPYINLRILNFIG